MSIKIMKKWKRVIAGIRELKEIWMSRFYCYNEVLNPIIKHLLHGI